MLFGWYIHRHVKSDLLVKFHKCFNAAGLRVNLLQVEIICFSCNFCQLKVVFTLLKNTSPGLLKYDIPQNGASLEKKEPCILHRDIQLDS